MVVALRQNFGQLFFGGGAALDEAIFSGPCGCYSAVKHQPDIYFLVKLKARQPF